jgi:hypothetical protein
MASQTGYTSNRPVGLKRSVDRFSFEGKIKCLATAKGFAENRVTIIGDSHIQFLQDLLYVSIQSVPGAYARDLVNLCNIGRLDILDFKAVVIFAGSNDVTDSTPSLIVASITNIVNHIRLHNPTALIAVCTVLRRPCDALNPLHFHRIPLRDAVNTAIRARCSTLNVHVFKVDKAIKGKGPDNIIFHTDLLHLSDIGIGHLKKWLEGRIGSLLGNLNAAN